MGVRGPDRSLRDSGAEQGSWTSADLEDAAPVEGPGRSLAAGSPVRARKGRAGEPIRAGHLRGLRVGPAALHGPERGPAWATRPYRDSR